MSGNGKPNLKARRKRLLVLADWLENVVQPALNGAKFDMCVWAGKTNDMYELYDYSYDVTRIWIEEDIPKNPRAAKECGYVGCAIGWGLTCPALRKPLLEHVNMTSGVCFYYYDLAAIFGISSCQAEIAFSPDSYRAKKPRVATVAKRLREIAASAVE